MPKLNVTRFSNLSIDPSLDPGNVNKIFRTARITDEEKNKIPSDALKGGEVIYNTSSNRFNLYSSGGWSDLAPMYRTGLVTNIGDVQGAAVPNLTVSGCITSASKAEPGNEGNEIVINYNDAGYVPLIFVQVSDKIGNNGLAISAVRPGHTSTQAKIFLRQEQGFGNPAQDVDLFIMLTGPAIDINN